MQQTYYQILEISSDSSAEEIKRAYRSLIQQHHPDRHVMDEEKLAAAEEMAKQINMAYHVLSDPKARRKYDHDLRYGASYAAANQTYTETPAAAPQQPYRPQFRWKTEKPPTTLTREQQCWMIAFIIVFICCSLVPLLAAIFGGDNTNRRITPTPEPTITITAIPSNP